MFSNPFLSVQSHSIRNLATSITNYVGIITCYLRSILAPDDGHNCF